MLYMMYIMSIVYISLGNTYTFIIVEWCVNLLFKVFFPLTSYTSSVKNTPHLYGRELYFWWVTIEVSLFCWIINLNIISFKLNYLEDPARKMKNILPFVGWYNIQFEKYFKEIYKQMSCIHNRSMCKIVK